MMDETGILTALLPISIVLGILLTFVTTAAAGRTIADLERQQERGVTGAPKIQTWVNLRINLVFMALGVTFVVINALLLAGAPEIWRMRTNRTGWTLLLAACLVIVVLNWLAEKAQVRLALREMAAARTIREALATEALERRATDTAAHRESYQQIAAEAVEHLEEATNQALAARGEPPLVVVAAVVPEHSSPVSPQQKNTALVATLRARLVAVMAALGLPPREPTTEEGV